MLSFLALFLASLVNSIVYCNLENFNIIIIPISKLLQQSTYNEEDSNPTVETIDFENHQSSLEPYYQKDTKGWSQTQNQQYYYDNKQITLRASEQNYEDQEDPLRIINPEYQNVYYSHRPEESYRSGYDQDYSSDTQVLQVDPRLLEYYAVGEDKIVGGFEVDINLYPYHVAYGTNCGGAIIDKNWVITAGHCGSKSFVRVGSKHISQGQRVNVKKHFVHPTWSVQGKDHPFDYDFQLLELSESLKFDENVQPIKLAHIEDMKIGTVVTVTGWGNTKENGPYSSILRAVRVPIISKDNCQSVKFPYFRGTLTPRMFCAGFKEGKKDACQGDSGGPAVAAERLLGMVSFGYGCATPGSYGVYSKVAIVRPWIEKVTGLRIP